MNLTVQRKDFHFQDCKPKTCAVTFLSHTIKFKMKVPRPTKTQIQSYVMPYKKSYCEHAQISVYNIKH